MANEPNKDEQFNVLFDDITEEITSKSTDVKEDDVFQVVFNDDADSVKEKTQEIKEQAEKAEEKAADFAEEVKIEASSLPNQAFEKVTEDASSLSSALEKEADDTQSAFEEFSFAEDEEERKAEDRYRRDKEEDEIQEPPVATKKEKKEKSQTKKSAQETSENARFWVFTAVIALLVVAAILFILYKRGFIFADHNVQNPTEDVTLPSIETSEDETLSEEETSLDESSDESSDESDASESETETETESEADLEKEDVLNHYENLFVIRGAEGNVNLRSAAGGDIIGKMTTGCGGSILGQDGTWYHVSSGGIEGYVSAEFVATGEEAKTLAVQYTHGLVMALPDQTLNLRSAASTDAEVLLGVPRGAVMEYLGEEGDFYHVNYNGTEGYVSKQFSDYGYYLDAATLTE